MFSHIQTPMSPGYAVAAEFQATPTSPANPERSTPWQVGALLRRQPFPTNCHHLSWMTTRLLPLWPQTKTHFRFLLLVPVYFTFRLNDDACLLLQRWLAYRWAKYSSVLASDFPCAFISWPHTSTRARPARRRLSVHGRVFISQISPRTRVPLLSARR